MYLPDRALELWLIPVDVMIPVSCFATLFGLLISDDITSSLSSSQSFYILVVQRSECIMWSILSGWMNRRTGENPVFATPMPFCNPLEHIVLL